MRTEALGEGYLVCTSESCKLCADPFMLADFAKPQHGAAADFGTGCGIIALLWAKNTPCRRIVGIELDLDAAELARRGVERSDCADRVRIICGDLRRPRELFAPHGFELVAFNPPYFKIGTGCVSPDPYRARARSETDITPEQTAAAASMALCDGGRFAICLPPCRLEEFTAAALREGLFATRRRAVMHTPDAQPYLTLAEFCKNLHKEPVEEAPFIISRDGEYTQEYKRLYGGYYQ